MPKAKEIIKYLTDYFDGDDDVYLEDEEGNLNEFDLCNLAVEEEEEDVPAEDITPVVPISRIEHLKKEVNREIN